MSFLDGALDVAGAAAKAYGGAARRRPPMQQSPMTPGWGGQMPPVQPGQQQQAGGVQPRQEGPMMDYLRRAIHPRPTGSMPSGVGGGLPGDTQIPMGPTPPVAGPPTMPIPYPRPPVPQGDQNSGSGMAANGQAFAQGGVVDKPTTAIIGEDGPEMVIPLSGRADAKVSPRNIPQMNYGRR